MRVAFFAKKRARPNGGLRMRAFRGFSNDGMLMATCGADGTARIWRAASLSEADAGLNGGDGQDPQ